MPVPADDRHAVLPCERRDPYIVGRNGASDSFQAFANFRIDRRRVFVDAQYAASLEKFNEPTFISRTVTRTPDSILELTQSDYRYRDFGCACQRRSDIVIAIRHAG